MATIRKHRGKWQVRVRREGIVLTKTFTAKQDAGTWGRLTELRAERHELPPDMKQLSQITLADLVRRYRNEVSPSKKGADVEAAVLNAFLRHAICKKRLCDVTTADFAKYRDERLRHIKPNSLRRQLNPIQNMFKVARKDWGIPVLVNPVSALEFKAGDDQRERRVSDEEWDALLRAVEAARNPYIQPLMRLGKETGMRRSEMLRIVWKHVNLKKRELYVPPGKNNKARTIVLTQAAADILEGLRKDGPLFPITKEAVKCAWRRVRKRAGLEDEDLRFHDFRHEAISRFFEMDLSVLEVANQSGHKDARMLLRYGHAIRAKITAKLDKRRLA
ncbi:tyrosine-type recombinase/integrase [Bradyrhizobium lablabi]|uniref:tyrosine-type recombinase/integrase n=1 Tax=Bradyrhizobium lablabi TaxID=722472 RepID=UPI000909F719|nr:site-specific integrase [Bradyrhizobium lablabi]SHL54951.1 Site-specific recombinase XerD [Bradyrhizobium lablabi]